MRKLWIIAVPMWLVWVGCGTSNAQQAKKSPPAKPAETNSDSGPSLDQTLSFLNNSFQNGAGQDIDADCSPIPGYSVHYHMKNSYSIDLSKFPTLAITVTGISEAEANVGKPNHQEGVMVYSIDLRRVDPQRVVVNSVPMWGHSNCTSSPAWIELHLEGTDKQSISEAGAEFNIMFSSADLANRVAKAMKRAVELAGGKPSAF